MVRGSVIALFALLVVLAGCSQLASEGMTPTPEVRTVTPLDAATAEPPTTSGVATPPTAMPTPTRTPGSTPTPTPTSTATPEPPALRMTDLDPDGEALTLRNTGGTVLDLDGYAIDFDGLAQVYVLPNHTLDPGESVRVRTGRGNDTGSVLYAGFFEPVIHGGDTIVVETSDREIVDGRRLDG